jgi:two-component system, chemotaxis family, chemotaxis protein CheY
MISRQNKILIVDDSALMRSIVRQLLLKMGLTEITEAEDGEIGLLMLKDALLCQDPFQVVISDWSMPNMTGLELLKLVRADTHLSNLPFIMVTPEGEDQYVKVAQSEKVSRVIIRPFILKDLQETLTPYLKT